jgi:hypothetical protein|tara:strand:- start:100 stop:435 length:336 start_codon:yes stop_codon:yes gene_type:complete
MAQVPVNWGDMSAWVEKIAFSVNSIDNGKISTNSTVTLAASAATTTVTDRKVGKDSVISFMPLTANAAAELTALYVSAQDGRANTFTITHNNAGTTDRSYRYIVLGQTIND